MKCHTYNLYISCKFTRHATEHNTTWKTQRSTLGRNAFIRQPDKYRLRLAFPLPLCRPRSVHRARFPLSSWLIGKVSTTLFPSGDLSFTNSQKNKLTSWSIRENNRPGRRNFYVIKHRILITEDPTGAKRAILQRLIQLRRRTFALDWHGRRHRYIGTRCFRSVYRTRPNAFPMVSWWRHPGSGQPRNSFDTLANA